VRIVVGVKSRKTEILAAIKSWIRLYAKVGGFCACAAARNMKAFVHWREGNIDCFAGTGTT
jgi:hypothetical protein